MKNKPLLYIVSILLVVVSSCTVTRPYQAPEVGRRDLFRDPPSADTSTIADLHWTGVFGDTLLQNLIHEGIDNNLNLKIAYSRIQQAEAYFNQSQLNFLPNVNADATVLTGKIAKTTASAANTTLYQINMNASWEADIWGKLRSTKRANLASLLQTYAYSKAVQTDLVAGIAGYYYTLLALDRELGITQQSVKNWITTVDMMKSLKESDVVTEAAVVQSQASRYAAEVTIPDLKQSIAATENALSILLGRVPGTIKRSSLFEQKEGNLLHIGVPVQLLANRPDVQEAELNFRYNFELTNVARTYFYPSLIISANGGFSSLSLTNLINPASLVGSITGGLFQPIFNQGLNRMRLKVSQAGQQQALLAFQNSLLTAGQEVSNDMSAYRTALEKTGLRDNEITNLQKAVEYTQLLVRYSSANYTEVLTAQQSLLSAQLGQVNDQLQQLQAMVNLYRDLGGGWK